MLRAHMMGENRARFGNAIEETVGCGRHLRRSLQLHFQPTESQIKCQQ